MSTPTQAQVIREGLLASLAAFVFLATVVIYCAHDPLPAQATTAPHWEEAETSDYTQFKSFLSAGWEPFAVTPYNREGSANNHATITERTYYLRRRTP